jgi:hypothetical protein
MGIFNTDNSNRFTTNNFNLPRKPLLQEPDAKEPPLPKEKKAVVKDIYSETPLRLLGFTNEVGAAIVPVIGPVGELISNIPGLAFIAMDTFDKYQKGEDKTGETPSVKKGIEQFIFQLFASVILPTAALKGVQLATDKLLNLSVFASTKTKINSWLATNKTLSNMINKLADKPHDITKAKGLTKFALHFQKGLDVVSVVPWVCNKLFKEGAAKSGLRNLGLAAVGLTTLGFAIKPIDQFTEHVIMDKAVKPLLYGKKDENDTSPLGKS